MKNNFKNLVFLIFILACTSIQNGLAEDGNTAWKTEFERICAQTEVATSLTKAQLLTLISDSEKLLEQLQAIDDPWAKVYILRLENCREFFRFTLEWQEAEDQDEAS